MSNAGRRWLVSLALALAGAGALAAPAAADFPAADSGYHNYDELSAETLAIAARYPALVHRTSIGKSHEGRDIWALKVSDNVATDEAEPEALFFAGQHAREHLTIEMALYLLDELTAKYLSDARIRAVVDSREIWIVPNVNPDGSEFDIATGRYASWRKNRQPTAETPYIGTDLNRNWGYKWGCCEGSDNTGAGETFRGLSAFSSPEVAVMRDFVLSRRIGGVQQLKVGIDFHTFGELVMWPFAYTYDDTAPGLGSDQLATFSTIGRSLAQSNGFTPQQASDLYISDGNSRDWLWGSEGIFAFGFELYPKAGNGGFYPPDEVIPAQTSRNREAVLRLLEIADCPYRAIGKELEYCGIGTPQPPPPPPGPAGAQPPPPPPPPQPPQDDSPIGTDGELATAAIAVTRAGLSASGHVRLRVRCAATPGTRCRGVLKLAARLPGPSRMQTIAKTNYVLEPGTRAVALRLGPKSRRALRRRSAITATATITSQQETTGAATTATARVKLVRRPARRD